MNIHSANILQLFQQYVVSQDAPLSHKYVDQVWSPSCSYQGNNCGYGEVGAQSAIQYNLVGTALMDRKLMISFSDLHQNTHHACQHTTLYVQKKDKT